MDIFEANPSDGFESRQLKTVLQTNENFSTKLQKASFKLCKVFKTQLYMKKQRYE